jgi:poly-gamma-glutamate synthesis protein (capsule biosynthesis protein)
MHHATRLFCHRGAIDCDDMSLPPTFRLMLAGDVMTGRGIDQIMPEPLPSQLFEPWVHDAREYVGLA